jgi:hypothetical protein
MPESGSLTPGLTTTQSPTARAIVWLSTTGWFGFECRFLFLILLLVQPYHFTLQGNGPFFRYGLHIFIQAPGAFMGHHLVNRLYDGIQYTLAHFFTWLNLGESFAEHSLKTLKWQGKFLLSE